MCLKVLVEFGLLLLLLCCCDADVLMMLDFEGRNGSFIDKSRHLKVDSLLRATMLLQEYLSNDLKKS